MNPSTERALERVLRKMSRPPRARRGFSRAPLILGIGMTLAYHLLVRLVPKVWEATLPGGLDQARQLRGWPGLVFGLAAACYRDFTAVVVTIAVTVVAAFVIGRAGWPFRLLIWAAALGMIVVNAAILVITLGTALRATAGAAGVGL